MDNPCQKSLGALGLDVSYEKRGKQHGKFHSDWLQLYESGCATRPGSSRGFTVGQLGDQDESHQSSEVESDDQIGNINEQYSSVLLSKVIYARYERAVKRVEELLAKKLTKKQKHKPNQPRISAGASSNNNPSSNTSPDMVRPPCGTDVAAEPHISFNPVVEKSSSATSRAEMFPNNCDCFEPKPAKLSGDSKNDLGASSIKVCAEPVLIPKTEPQPAVVALPGTISESSNFSYCTCTQPTPAIEPTSDAPSTSQEAEPFSHCHMCKRPIIVVPGGEGVPLPHSKHGPTPKSTDADRKTHSQAKAKQKSDKKMFQKEIKIEKASHSPQFPRPNLHTEDPLCACPSQSDQETHSLDLALISEISQQLCEMNRKLERIQTNEILEIRNQMDTLRANVQSLNKKFHDKELKKESSAWLGFTAELNQVTSVKNSEHSVKAPKNVQHYPENPKKNGMEIKDRSSSNCEFCKDKNLPVLNSFHCELIALMGDLKFSEVLMSILLRRDNVYHVRVQDMIHDEVLGCFLVSDAGIEEAIKLGVFEQTMTFSVVDVRNTLKAGKGALGIAFEFSDKRRECL
ncbi:uncharacterized protein LOC117900498 [Drosophila subobscura]|uniref:uncharacterized protein LOC117900498 n=1 Tax=Drosophila subobscura TaxID=7241 RepID=UPI00155A502A|nr:uncharacterized protein LOC117900498 [Drosophila subobscura]